MLLRLLFNDVFSHLQMFFFLKTFFLLWTTTMKSLFTIPKGLLTKKIFRLILEICTFTKLQLYCSEITVIFTVRMNIFFFFTFRVFFISCTSYELWIARDVFLFSFFARYISRFFVFSKLWFLQIFHVADFWKNQFFVIFDLSFRFFQKKVGNWILFQRKMLFWWFPIISSQFFRFSFDFSCFKAFVSPRNT